MDTINSEIIFIYNNDDDFKQFSQLNTEGYKLTLYDLRKHHQAKLAEKYKRLYHQTLVPLILVYREKELVKIFIQTKVNDAISDLNRFLNESPEVEKLNMMFKAFIEKCKKHFLNKREVLNLINKYYE